MLNLLTATLDTDFRLIGEAVAAGAKVKDALVKALAAIESKESKSAVIAPLQAAVDAFESSDDVYGYPKSDESAFLVEADKEGVVKALKAALLAAGKEDWDTAKAKVRLVLSALGADDEEKEEPKEEKEEVDTEPDLDEGEFSESLFGAVELEEAVNGNPLMMKVKIIQPGWGNARDNNYYGIEMLKEHAPKFVGAKMFETDHKAKETNNRTWVSTITALDGFTDTGAPLFEVLAHAPDFIQRVQNLKTGELLEKLECSIRATGLTRKGSVEGREGHIVEAITGVKSVDWVSKAGAGGHAVDAEPLVESDSVPRQRPKPLLGSLRGKPKPEQRPGVATGPVITYLSEDVVEEMLGAATLPKAVRTRLQERKYLDQDAVTDAVTAERTYLREATGSGSVTDMNGKTDSHTPTVTLDEVNVRRDAINKKWLGGR